MECGTEFSTEARWSIGHQLTLIGRLVFAEQIERNVLKRNRLGLIVSWHKGARRQHHCSEDRRPERRRSIF